MAQTPMVRESPDPLIQAVKRAVVSLEDSHGPLYAAVLVHLQEMATNDWILLVGSKRLLQRRLDGIHAIADALKGRIPKVHATRIRRVDVLRPDDPLYLYLSRAFHVVPGADATIHNCNVFGLEVEHAVLFAMNTEHAPSQDAGQAAKRRRGSNLRRAKR